MERERLRSRIGFVLISAGCAIGCGNVWRFPWMTGRNGGGGFVLIYLICLLLLGLPVLVMEYAIGRAAQASSVRMYQKLEPPGSKWHIHGYLSFAATLCMMAFYTVVTGWMIYYFLHYLIGDYRSLSFSGMLGSAGIQVGYMGLVVALGFGILSRNIQSGLERVTSFLMCSMPVMMLAMVVHCMTLSGAREGLHFYLVPDFSKITFSVIADAMNQTFATLSLGIGAMAIIGSYIGKERSLMEESVHVILMDTLVSITAGMIIFPACFTYGQEVTAGPALLYNTMTAIFNDMPDGRAWGALFFLFMTFASFSTVLSVFETTLASVRELTGWGRPKGCLVCGGLVFLLALTTALGYNVWSGFAPFGEGTTFLNLWDFLVATNLMPIGSFVTAWFCCSRAGWGWDGFTEEANAGKGLKVHNWMRPMFGVFAPAVVMFLYVYGLIGFFGNLG